MSHTPKHHNCRAESIRHIVKTIPLTRTPDGALKWDRDHCPLYGHKAGDRNRCATLRSRGQQGIDRWADVPHGFKLPGRHEAAFPRAGRLVQLRADYNHGQGHGAGPMPFACQYFYVISAPVPENANPVMLLAEFPKGTPLGALREFFKSHNWGEE